MTPYPIAFAVGFVAVALAQALVPASVPKTLKVDPGREPQPVGHGLWVGLMLATLGLGIFQDRLPVLPNMRTQGIPSMTWLFVGALPVMLATLYSDFHRPSSERHAVGLLGSGVGLYAVGFSIFVLSSPLGGTVNVLPLWQVVLTILWLFLLASIVELVSLVPMGVTLFGLALSGMAWVIGGTQQSVASYALEGLIGGALVGRALTDAVLRRSRPLGKTEVFVLGYWLTAMTNVAFLKSVALAGFVLPLGALAVGIILLTLRAFERSLLLRDAPRAE